MSATGDIDAQHRCRFVVVLVVVIVIAIGVISVVVLIAAGRQCAVAMFVIDVVVGVSHARRGSGRIACASVANECRRTTLSVERASSRNGIAVDDKLPIHAVPKK